MLNNFNYAKFIFFVSAAVA